MTEDEKRELLKNDMKMAMEFGNVVDLQDMKQLYNLKLLLGKKPYFKTNLHMIYMRRIEEILANNSTDTCLKCKRVGTADGFWCQECMDSILAEKTIANAEETSDNIGVAVEKKRELSEMLRLIALFLSLTGLIIITAVLLTQGKKGKLEAIEQPAIIEQDNVEIDAENTVESDENDFVPIRINYISEEVILNSSDEAKTFLLEMFESDENQEAVVEYIGESASDRINFLLPIGDSLASGADYAKAHPEETNLFESVECWMFSVDIKTKTDEQKGLIFIDSEGHMLLDGTIGGNPEGIMIRFR